jgi:hypothetical protein
VWGLPCRDCTIHQAVLDITKIGQEPLIVAPGKSNSRGSLGLYEDYAAVKAGVTLPWSTGPVEGHINRLKMLKRQMFGRAHVDLLSRRFVLTPRGEQAQTPGPCTPSQVYAQAEAA